MGQRRHSPRAVKWLRFVWAAALTVPHRARGHRVTGFDLGDEYKFVCSGCDKTWSTPLI